jgi:hypothetical protein
LAASLHLRGVGLAGEDARPGAASQLGEAAAVVEVRLAVEDHLHVRQPEPESLTFRSSMGSISTGPVSSRTWPAGVVRRKALISLAPT